MPVHAELAVVGREGVERVSRQVDADALLLLLLLRRGRRREGCRCSRPRGKEEGGAVRAALVGEGHGNEGCEGAGGAEAGSRGGGERWRERFARGE